MKLDPRHIDSSKTKVIGKLGSDNVVRLQTTGGFCLVVAANNKGEVLGAGSHPALALHIAKKKHKDLKVTELTKSEEVNPAVFADMIDKWEAITDSIRKHQK